MSTKEYENSFGKFKKDKSNFNNNKKAKKKKKVVSKLLPKYCQYNQYIYFKEQNPVK